MNFNKQLIELVREMTIGVGDSEISDYELFKLIEERTARRLNETEKQIVSITNLQCKMEFENP